MAGESIFIGYRRDDTADVAGRIFDALAARFGRERVFKDVDNLRPGEDFGEHIKSILPNCQVALVLIGPTWIDAKDTTGSRLLDDPHDWVRVEIELAINARNLDIVPVLVNGASMPRADELPNSLRPLLTRHAATVRRDPDFHDDITRLSSALDASLTARNSGAPTLRGERHAIGASAGDARRYGSIIGVVLVLALVGFVAFRLLPSEPVARQEPIIEVANGASHDAAAASQTQAPAQLSQAGNPCDQATEQWSALSRSSDEDHIAAFVQSTSASCAARALAQARLEELREAQSPETTGETIAAYAPGSHIDTIPAAPRPDPQSLVGRWRVVGSNCAALYPELNVRAASNDRVDARQSLAGSFSRMISGTYSYDAVEASQAGITYRRPDLYNRSRALQTLTWVYASNSIILVTNPEGQNAVACTYVR